LAASVKGIDGTYASFCHYGLLYVPGRRISLVRVVPQTGAISAMLRGLLTGAAALSALAALDIAGRSFRRWRRRLLSVRERPPPPGVAVRLDAAAPVVRATPHHAAADECTFCLGRVRARTRVRVTRCGHVFHRECLEQWVYHCADECLNWANYSLAADGRIDGGKPPPSCPNCAADLGVLGPEDVKQTLLVAVARSLSLRDVALAAELYDNGLVLLRGTENETEFETDDGAEAATIAEEPHRLAPAPVLQQQPQRMQPVSLPFPTLSPAATHHHPQPQPSQMQSLIDDGTPSEPPESSQEAGSSVAYEPFATRAALAFSGPHSAKALRA
jgi:RING-like zinc finger